VEIGVLGPLEVRGDDGGPIALAGARLRALLIALALDPGRVVPASRLVDAIWGDESPDRPANALQALVSRLRRVLPAGAVESHPSGYRLAVGPEAVDVTRAERLVAAGRARLADDPAGAADDLRRALATWRGPSLVDVADEEAFRARAVHLDDLRLAATEDRLAADLRLGRAADATAELTALVAEHPLRERLVGLLMRALVAAGRPSDALAAYEDTRTRLVERLGTDPSAELSALHLAVLRGELGGPPAPPAPASAPAPGSTLAPRPASGGTPPTNLRAALTSFVGRDRDLVRVREMVGEYRLVTLTGPGGSGKTRLAVEASRPLVGDMPHGVWLVELAPLGPGADLAAAVLAALGVRDTGIVGPDPADGSMRRLAAALRSRRLLVVLDNCEHVVADAADLADRLLGECPDLRILATSREPLGIVGEAVWPVEPLGLPPLAPSGGPSGGEPGGDDAGVAGSDAVRLFAERGRAARPGFAVTAEVAPAVTRICRALDGMPLAIEMAAARLRTMTVEQVADRLDDRFRLLTGGSRTALPRHRALRAVVDWSWDLLSDEERAVLRRLAVFAGGATPEAAAAVCAGPPVDAGRVPDLLASLTDKSLLVLDDTGPAPRYRMLETLKAYGLERLDEAGEREATRRAHAAHVVARAEEADPHLRRAEQLTWLRRVAADHDEVTAALRGAIAAGDAATAVRLAAAAGWYWWLGGHKAEGAELVAAALAVPGPTDPVARATAYAVAGLFASAGLAREDEAFGFVAAARELPGWHVQAHPLLRAIGPLAELLGGDPESPVDIVGPLLDDPDPWVRAQGYRNRAQMRLEAGDTAAAVEADVEASLAGFRAIGERWGMSFALTTLADLVARRGDLVAADGHYEAAIAVLTEMGTLDDVVYLRARQAQLRWLRGDEAGSAAAVAEAERAATTVGWPHALAAMAQAQAELARWSGDVAGAWAALARADEALEGIAVHPLFRAMLADTAAHLEVTAGRPDAARARRAEALALAADPRDTDVTAKVLVGVADQALLDDRPEDALALLAAARAILGGCDLPRPDAARVEAGVRRRLGDEAFAEAARRAADEVDGATATAREAAARRLAADVVGTRQRTGGRANSARAQT
jgi:predicted ATPase/DNA-binding SARP family transcriptional activator